MSELEERYIEIHKLVNEEEIAQAGEGIETIVCKNLYCHIFNVEAEQALNKRLQEQI
jgi:hypothetical protein